MEELWLEKGLPCLTKVTSIIMIEGVRILQFNSEKPEILSEHALIMQSCHHCHENIQRNHSPILQLVQRYSQLVTIEMTAKLASAMLEC